MNSDLSLTGEGTTPDLTIPDPATTNDRPMGRAMLHGWRRRCPACGTGPLLRGYLKVRDQCAVCNTALHHHRADDGPAYLTILIVGKLLTPMLFVVLFVWRPDPLATAAAFCIAAVTLSLFLLPRLKGALVGIQWSRRMHGFADEGKDGKEEGLIE